MVSQKNLSHSSLIWSVAPPRRRLRLAWAPLARFLFEGLGWRASSFEEVRAARGGLEGGEGSPEIGTSGIPLGPCSPGSAVVQALEGGLRVDDVAAGEDVDLGGLHLAVITTTRIGIVFHWRHCNRGNPERLSERCEEVVIRERDRTGVELLSSERDFAWR